MIRIKFDKAIRPSVLIMAKMSGYIKIFKGKEGDNKLMSFCLDDEKVLKNMKLFVVKLTI